MNLLKSILLLLTILAVPTAALAESRWLATKDMALEVTDEPCTSKLVMSVTNEKFRPLSKNAFFHAPQGTLAGCVIKYEGEYHIMLESGEQASFDINDFTTKRPSWLKQM